MSKENVMVFEVDMCFEEISYIATARLYHLCHVINVALCLSPNESLLVVISDMDATRIIDLANGQAYQSLSHTM